MAIIQITPELLESKASEVRTIRSNHDETMTRLRNLIYSLNEQWKGEAQASFVQKFESMSKTFTSFSEMLEDYAKKMDTNARQLRDKDAELASLNKA